MNNMILNSLISTILVGIPEFGFISMLAMIILRSIEKVGTNKAKTVMLVVLPALLTNLPEVLGIGNYDVIVAMSLVISIVSLMVLTKLITRKGTLSVIFSVLASFVVFLLTEYTLGLSIQVACHITMDDIAKNPLIAFFGSMPERVVQYITLYVISINGIKKIFTPKHQNIDILTIIASSKSYKRNSIIILGMTILHFGTFIGLFAVGRALTNISVSISILLSVMILCAPAIVLLIFIESLYKSYDSSKAYMEYLISNAKAKAIKVYNSALAMGDKDTIEAAKSLIISLDLTE